MDPTGGRWLAREIIENKHINCHELKAVKLGLKALCDKEECAHILIQLDNVTGVTFINNMGGTHSKLCNNVVLDISLWCIERKIWITATHIPGIQNETACNIIMELWRIGTTKQYPVYLDKWANFATVRNENPIHPTLANVTEFLTHLYDTGNSYLAINTTRLALPLMVDLANSPYTVGKHPLIKRLAQKP